MYERYDILYFNICPSPSPKILSIIKGVLFKIKNNNIKIIIKYLRFNLKRKITLYILD